MSLTITDENFHNQRETVKEERRLRVDNQPYSPAFIDGMTWPFDSAGCFAYAHTVIGSMDDLNAAQLPDVRAFFDTFYAPNNATLVVVGDFKPLELRRYVNQYFSEIPRHPEPPPVRCTARVAPGIQRREVVFKRVFHIPALVENLVGTPEPVGLDHRGVQIEHLLVLRENYMRPDIIGDTVHVIAPAQAADLFLAFQDYRLTVNERRQRQSRNATTKDYNIRLHVMFSIYVSESAVWCRQCAR